MQQVGDRQPTGQLLVDGGGLVEDDEKALAFVVHALEGFGILLGPWDHVDAPCALAVWVLGNEGSCVEDEVIAGEPAEVEPAAKFGPCFSFKLGLGVGLPGK